MKIALAQPELRAGHPQFNTQKITRFIYDAKREGATALVLPDNYITGTPPSEEELPAILRADLDSCRQQIKEAAVGIELITSSSELDPRKDFVIDNQARPFAFLNVEKSGGEKKSLLGRLISARKPKIRVNSVGIDNRGKFISVFDGRSTVFNAKGVPVLRAEAFKEQLLYFEKEELDKMPEAIGYEESETERIYHALKYGVKRYLELIGMKKIVIGASGGIDSAVAAALYVDVLGAENVYLVNMPTHFNSLTTRGLSEQLAKNLGCQYMIVSIEDTIESTVKQLESTTIKLQSDGSTSKLELNSFVRENMQARDRSARVLAAIAASLNCGFTCNANKAEATIGYATLYGDCAGLLAATADLWKYQMYELAEYFNDEVYMREVIPQGIIDIVPSAELSNAQNVDEGKGDPVHYDYHDYLFRAFVENNRQPEELLKWYADGKLEAEIGCGKGLAKKYFASDKEFVADLERWWNQYRGIAAAKRMQTPPLIVVSGKPFSANETLCGAYYTRGYQLLKKILLGTTD